MIKKKNTNPPEYHFTEEDRALAQRAHERLLAIVAVATYYLWPKYLEWTGRDRFEQLARASSSNPHGKLSADAFELALRQDEELRKELRMLESHLN